MVIHVGFPCSLCITGNQRYALIFLSNDGDTHSHVSGSVLIHIQQETLRQGAGLGEKSPDVLHSLV